MKKQNLGPNQKQWLRALRSGCYKQTQKTLGLLEAGPGFCCLGVACLLFGEPSRMGWTFDGKFFVRTDTDVWDTSVLPREIAKDLALFSPAGDPSKNAPVGTQPLFVLNDREKLSFAQIADIIEAHPEHYFKKPR